MRLFVLCLILLGSSAAFSQISPARKPVELYEAKAETVVRVSTARVIAADYDLIRRDFEVTRNMSNEQIDGWLLKNTAYVSRQQAAQDIVNTPIQLSGETRRAQRPYEYRRALVFEVEGGMIDSKGNGAVDPSPGSHDNGLGSLGEMIREFLYERLVREIFSVNRNDLKTVANYAVLDLGFDIKAEGGRLIRAGTVLRQAHRRNHNRSGLLRHKNYRGQASMLKQEHQILIESVLRSFGITSTGASGDRLNLQGTSDGAVVDFGAFLTLPHFEGSVLAYNDNSVNPEVIWSEKNLIQPNEKFRVPFDLWGYSETGEKKPNYDNPYVWSHRLAESLRNGSADRSAMDRHMENMLGPMREKLKGYARSCNRLF